MKSVGETMAIGRTFKESFQKALRGLEVGSFGFGCDGKDLWDTPEQPSPEEIRAKLATPNDQRVWHLRYAIKCGISLEEIFELTAIDPWFLENLQEIVALEERLRGGRSEEARRRALREAKRCGFSDRQLAVICGMTEMDVRAERKRRGVVACFKAVDTCAAEFEAYTPYYYSTYEDEDETPAKRPGQRRVIILGGGPNRIGQGIEFDYCCCHASFALRELGIQSIMVNSNPETVSTDYDTSDLLFFEPLTTEDVLNICDRMQPDGVIVQFGGQTPLNLARALANAGVPIIGTSVDTIEDAEDREKFANVLSRLGLKQPANGIARNMAQARADAAQVGFPSLVRPSFVLGRRAMEICYDAAQFERFVAAAFVVSQGQPVLIDRFLEDATEVDVDAIADGRDVIVAGIMEHIEEAGVHSGDSACAIPPYSLPGPVVAEIRQATCMMARHPQVKGLMNVQYAVKREQGRPVVYVLEVNPRASRTVPFVSKAIGMALAKAAAKVMVGISLAEQGWRDEPIPSHVSVKEAVFPFSKFAGVDIVLGPEMRSTGEVMGSERTLLHRLRKEPVGRRHDPPHKRQNLHQRRRSGEGTRRRAGQAAGENGLPTPRHPRHRRAAGSGGRSRRAGEEAPAGASESLGPHGRRRPPPGDQHAQRQGRADRRRANSRRGRFPRHPLHHDDPGRRRRRLGDGSPAIRRTHRAGPARPLPTVGQRSQRMSVQRD